MPKKELEQRSYNFEISAEESEGRNIITGRPIVYGSRANIGEFDEIIHPGALNKTDLKDVRFLVNHDTSKIPLARSRRNNSNSTMQLMVDENGMNIKVMLDTENNAEARALYSAVQRGDISGMSFMFGVDQDDWDDLETDHPTRNIRSINNVVEVSAVTFPAYEATEINTRSKETLAEARSALEKARAEEKEKPQDNLELEKLKTQTLMKRYNHNHDEKGRFTFSSGSGGSGGDGISQPKVNNTPKQIGPSMPTIGKQPDWAMGREQVNDVMKLKKGEQVAVENDEFDGKSRTNATVTDVYKDHIIATSNEDNRPMKLWLDKDTVDGYSCKVYKYTK